MAKHILILGGYGGVGRACSRMLLQYTDADITIAGRRTDRAAAQTAALRQEFPGRQINAAYADADDRAGLTSAFKGADLVLITATTPDRIGNLAEAALEAGADMMDIHVRGDVVDKLEPYRGEILRKNRIFITQAGFHPGLPAPLIRFARSKFDTLETADTFMAMNALFEKPESACELVYELGESDTRILKNGVWKKAGYRDVVNVEFSHGFGKRACYPLELREIYPLQDQYGIRNMGVYAAGFNWFIDNFVFPLSMLMQMVRKGWGNKMIEKLIYWGAKTFFSGKPGVEFRLEAHGTKAGKPVSHRLVIYSDDPYLFTAASITACVLQYLDGTIAAPGLHLMGLAVDSARLIEDLGKMGANVEENPLTP